MSMQWDSLAPPTGMSSSPRVPLKAMKILLVKPKARLRTVLGLEALQRLEPIELGYLAAAVPNHHSVKVVDLRLIQRAEKSFRSALKSFGPDIVGFTGYTHEASTVKTLSKIVRRCLPRAFVIAGGHHATVAPADFNTESIDAIVRGEGCSTFREFVRTIEEGDVGTPIPGLLWTGDYYDADQEKIWPQFPDPATLPEPRRDLWDPQVYRSIWVSEDMKPWERIFPAVSLVRASWGCRMKCTFCVVPHLCGGEHRPRPPDWVAEEIEKLPTDHVYFCDDENFIDEDFAWNLAEAIERRGIKKRYFAWTRSTTVNRSPDLLRKWRELGLDGAFLGFEFTNDSELKKAHKGGTVAGNERALDVLRNAGIAVHAGFMVTPDYTENRFSELRSYVSALPPAQCSFTVITPSPGTPDYDEMRPEMWVRDPFDLHDCMHPLTPTHLPLKRFADLFATQAAEGAAKTPLRQHNHPLVPTDLFKVLRAQRLYENGYRKMYQDYPRELWS